MVSKAEPTKETDKIRVVCISDTHTMHGKVTVPEGDILIHGGDFSNVGLPKDVLNFNAWLKTLPHKHKIVIAGNHDVTFDTENYSKTLRAKFHRFSTEPIKSEDVKALLTDCTYLEDSSVTIEGYKFHGSPWTPEFCGWGFMLDSEEEMLKKWKLIPDDTDILITHGPPYGILDQVFPSKMNVGCRMLAKEVLDRVKPLYHIFGHIHEGYGQTKIDNTVFINASTCTYGYKPHNAPVVFDLPAKNPPTS